MTILRRDDPCRFCLERVKETTDQATSSSLRSMFGIPFLLKTRVTLFGREREREAGSATCSSRRKKKTKKNSNLRDGKPSSRIWADEVPLLHVDLQQSVMKRSQERLVRVRVLGNSRRQFIQAEALLQDDGRRVSMRGRQEGRNNRDTRRRAMKNAPPLS